MRQGLIQELRAIRRGNGPYAIRLARLPWLIDSLGQGALERAITQLSDLRAQYADHPEDPVGAFFWLADQGLDDHEPSLEQRLNRYSDTFACDPRTALRRSDSGIDALAALARHRTRTTRPVGLFWFFQGRTATAVLDFWMNLESYREPVVTINDQPTAHEFVLHRGSDATDNDTAWGDRYRSRLILEDLPLSLDHDPYEPALAIRAAWDMPIWPVWHITAWIADPRFAVRLQTFHERAVEGSLIVRPGQEAELTETVHTR